MLTFISWPCHADEKDAPVVETTSIHTESVEQSIQLIGTLKAKNETPLYAQNSGTIDQIKVASGSFVTKGTEIARLENENLRRSFELAQKAEKLAKTHYERYQELFKKDVASKAGFEKVEKEWINAQSASHQAALQLEKTQIIAPFNGTVGIFKISQGASIKMGDEIVSIADNKNLMVDVNVPEDLLTQIKQGQKIYVKDRPGEITSLQTQIDPSTHMGRIQAKIDGLDLPIGSYISVDLVLSQKTNVLALPDNAIFQERARPYVYVVKDNKLVLTPVQTGLKGHGKTEITSGLEAGDQIVLWGQSFLSDGQEVRVTTQ